ncbi:MAG: DoxX family protein [Patescibacteria group bacterium]
MTLPHYSGAYEAWAPVIARLAFAATFLISAFFKIPGTETFTMQVGMAGAAGLPFPLVMVTLAFILEVCAGIALVIGWRTRTAGFLLALFTLLIAFVFYRNLADQAQFAGFMSCMALVAGLVYVSVYGAKHAAVRKD